MQNLRGTVAETQGAGKICTASGRRTITGAEIQLDCGNTRVRRGVGTWSGLGCTALKPLPRQHGSAPRGRIAWPFQEFQGEDGANAL